MVSGLFSLFAKRLTIVLINAIHYTLFFFSIPVLSQVPQEKIIISGKEIAERLTRLEEGQKALNKRIDDTNKRIDDLRAEMNRRFDDVNKSINILMWIMGLFASFVWG